jgi:AMP phosphorylase
MKLATKIFNVEAGGTYIVLLNEVTAKDLDVYPGDRVRLMAEGHYILAVINISGSVDKNEIGVYSEVKDTLNLDEGQLVTIFPEAQPSSIESIRKKLDGKKITKEEIYDIISDIVDNALTQAEIAYFVSAAYIKGFSVQEIAWLTIAMAETGEVLKWDKKPIMDKHCIGGVAGNRTSMIVLPIITAAGLIMPKTSSRSITSPSGTADTMEVLANVNFKTIQEVQKIVEKTNGCEVWGGSFNLAPADDLIIRVEHTIDIDPTPMLLSSIMAKKYVAGSTHVLIDIPVGPFAKIKTKKDYTSLARQFMQLGKQLNMQVKTVESKADQPIGNGLGPALEARDVLWVLSNNKKGPQDLKEKSLWMAGLMLEMGGATKKGQGQKLAKKILESGKALEQMKKIIKAQGGDPKIKPEQIKMGKLTHAVFAQKSGKVSLMNDDILSKAARLAGAPIDKGAGIYLHVHLKDKVKKGDTLYTIYAVSDRKLGEAVKYVTHDSPTKIS